MRHPLRNLLLLSAVLFPLLSASPDEVTTHPKRSSHNPLMPEAGELFDFARVNEETIRSAATYTENKVTVLTAAITGVEGQRTFDNTMGQLDELYNVLQKATSVYELLMSTSPDKGIRNLSGEMLEKFTSMTDALPLNEPVYKAIKAYAATTEAQTLSGERAYFLKKTLRQFELNGMNLPASDRDTLKMLNEKLNELSVEFGKNIASDKRTVTFTNSEVDGLSSEFLEKFRFPAEVEDYRFDLSTPTYNAFMSQCTNEASRKKMYVAKMNVGGAANEKLLVKILELRTRKAKLLGFSAYSKYATADIMSQNTANVWSFEKKLTADLRPKAQQDLKQLLDLKTKMTGKKATVIYPYDVMYYSTQLLKTTYNFDPEKAKEYFEINNVINGIFTVYQQLYNLRFIEDKNPSTWYKEVKAYSVYDNATNELIGYFYLDLFPRADKYNHAGCFGLTGSKTYANGKKQLRSAALVCNFPPPTADQPSLMPHNTVTTFFHEFGHLIHVLLSETQLAAFAGTNVATDFVEAPSQIMENWAWQKSVLSLFAKHYKTGAVIPDSLLNSMIAARNVNSGLNMLQQVYYGTLDFTLNDNAPPKSEQEIVDLTKKLQNEITLYPWVEGTHFAGTFGHLTGYGSKYYGYLWSLVYAYDMFSEFEKTDPLSPATGKRYRQNVLAKGGSDDAINLVRNFLGREPDNKAFLKQIGLNQ